MSILPEKIVYLIIGGGKPSELAVPINYTVREIMKAAGITFEVPLCGRDPTSINGVEGEWRLVVGTKQSDLHKEPQGVDYVPTNQEIVDWELIVK